MWLPPTWDICGLGVSKQKFLLVLILYMYLVAFSIHFLLWSHPNVVEPQQLLTAPSAQNSTRDSSIMQKRGFTRSAPASPMLPGIVLNAQTIYFFFHSTVFVVWEFSKLPLLNNIFSKKGRCGFFAFRDSRGNSLQARAGWLGRKTSTDTNYPREDKREARFSFTFLWGNCVAQSRLRAALN